MNSITAEPVAERLLVCVGPSPSSARLIREAYRLATGLQAEWIAITVDAANSHTMDQSDRHQLLAHLRLAESLGARVVTRTGRRVGDEIIRFAREAKITRIIVGKPQPRRWWEGLRGSLVHDLVRESGEIELHFTAGDETPPPMVRPARQAAVIFWLDYLISGFLVVITAWVTFLGRNYLSLPDTVMFFLLPIMVAAFWFGRGAAVVAAILSVGAFDFLFVPPVFEFSVEDFRYLLTFTIMFAVGITISTLMMRIRQQEQKAQERERRTAALYGLSRDLVTTLNEERAGEIIVTHANRIFSGQAAIFFREASGHLTLTAADPAAFRPDEAEMVTIQWSAQQVKPAGRGTIHQVDSSITCVPIVADRTFAILALHLRDLEAFAAENGGFLAAFVRQSGLAIDRARLSEEAKEAAIRVKSEELRNTLLSMASHDLRTPLAAIIGAGTALRDDEGNLTPQQRSDLLETVCSEAERMARLISNLLDMVKLESGGCQLRREWTPFEEIIGSLLDRLERLGQGEQVTLQVAENIPFLWVDPVSFQQVLFNLLDNGLKYAPKGSPIVVQVEAVADGVEIRVRDHGSGIPVGDEEQIFAKFSCGRATAGSGVGLGLAICRGIVQAHGGTITGANPDGGGAEFRIHLPQPTMPPEFFFSMEEAPGKGA